jgi:riboflavin kinase/FMN adenylyltransferase
MEVFPSLVDAARSGLLAGGAVAIGNFDGVHLGHRALVARALELARGGGARAGVLTFEPHPVRVLRPQLAPPLLTPLPRKLELLAAAGLDAVVVQPFDSSYAGTSAAGFVERDLAGALGLRQVVVGWDFTAGHERARAEALRPLLAAAGLGLHVVEPVAEGGLTVSSTKIREFLLEGNVEAAALLLTRPHDVDGRVVPGAGRGRGLGFATANLATAGLLPMNGVYAVRAWVRRPGAASGTRHGGVCNVGVKPTVESSGRVTAEVHLFGHDGGDLHGAALRLAFLIRLRDERRFPSLEALRAQIADDAERAQTLLEGRPDDGPPAPIVP